ncbi:MAG: septal ring lytic transglycosylase RlpA family protein [Candidatus Uhrbacteria bacterium]
MTRTFFAILFALVSFVATPVLADDATEQVSSTQFDAATIVKGFTLASGDGLFRLGIRPSTLNVATRVDVKTLDPSLMTATLPTDKTLVGSIYLFDILNKASYDGKDYFFLEIKYPVETSPMHGRRRIAFWNGVTGAWEELPSEDSPENASVRALIHLPYARLAIFDDKIPEVGSASWYGYKGCDCAASPDYPKGTYLVVSRVDDPTRTVTVKVNDYGPDRTVFPDRVIDLDKVAFKKIASLGAGVINVRVTLLQ